MKHRFKRYETKQKPQKLKFMNCGQIIHDKTL